MQRLAAVVTMVKDDYFFLQKWVDYYGGLFGRECLYVINHGGDAQVASIAQGCNVLQIPDGFDESFDAKRWRLMQNLTNGLRSYYKFVIVGDVDEYIVVDPKTKLDLAGFLSKRKNKIIITPLGLEVVHKRATEHDSVEDSILGPRRHVRFSSYFTKPCIIGGPVNLSRGGHYSDSSELVAFKKLYLLHMKYCDYDTYIDTKRRRVAAVEQAGAAGSDMSMLSKHWFEGDAGMDTEFDYLTNLPVVEPFSLDERLEEMEKTWEQRSSDLWHFKKHVGLALYRLPARFAGLV